MKKRLFIAGVMSLYLAQATAQTTPKKPAQKPTPMKTAPESGFKVEAGRFC